MIVSKLDNEKTFTTNLLEKINELQKNYNPTNHEFVLVEKHNKEEKELYVEVLHHNQKEEVIIANALIYYKEFNLKVYFDLYRDLNSKLLLKMMFSDTFKNIITSIDALQ